MRSLSEATVISRAPNSACRELEGKFFIVSAASTRLIMLNETGTAVWRYLESPCTMGDLVDRLVNEFEVERGQAARDCEVFVQSMVSRSLLEVAGPVSARKTEDHSEV